MAVDGSEAMSGKLWYEVTKTDYATIKYNSAGQEQWVARYDGRRASTMTVPPHCHRQIRHRLCHGRESWSVTNYEQYVTIKYNSAGQEQWDRSYNGPVPNGHQ